VVEVCDVVEDEIVEDDWGMRPVDESWGIRD
jgi:hypothetical protein